MPYVRIGAAAAPAVPAAAGAPNLAPLQGDHIFGDALGVIGNAFQDVMGGGALWQARFRGFNEDVARLWAGQAARNMGHADHTFVANRHGAAEPDQHAHMFGGYSARLRWQIVEIGRIDNATQNRQINGRTNAWKRHVMGALEDLLDHAVDDTALRYFLANGPGNRAADAANVVHQAISLRAAGDICDNANHAGRRAQVQGILTAYGSLPGALRGILDRWPVGTRTFNHATDTWA